MDLRSLPSYSMLLKQLVKKLSAQHGAAQRLLTPPPTVLYRILSVVESLKRQVPRRIKIRRGPSIYAVCNRSLHLSREIPAVWKDRSRLLTANRRDVVMDRFIGKPMTRAHDRQRADERASVIADRHGDGIDVFGEFAAFDGVAGFADIGSSARANVSIDDRFIGVTFQALRQILTSAAVRFQTPNAPCPPRCSATVERSPKTKPRAPPAPARRNRAE